MTFVELFLDFDYETYFDDRIEDEFGDNIKREIYTCMFEDKVNLVHAKHDITNAIS